MYKCKWFLCWFCIVILLNSFVTTACVLNLWDFLHIRLYLLRQFYLFLSNLHASNSSCLTALARTSSTMLNRGGSGHPWLFFFSVKKPSVFHCQSLLSTVILLAWLIYFLRQDSNLSTNYKSRIESSRWNVSCEKIHWLSGRDEPNIYLCHSIQYFLSLMN